MRKEKGALKLLLVDDEEDFLSACSRGLERRGFAVSTAFNGKRALQMLEEEEFDVVVLDLKMPGIDGEEVFRRLRIIRPEIPVLMLTGHGSVPHAFETAKKGMSDYATKPCDMDDLAERVRRIVGDTPSTDSRGSTGAAKHFPGRPAAGATAPHVLIIDDEKELLSSLGSFFSRRRLGISTADSPEAAFDILDREAVDVVVLDIKMPELDGFEILRMIKQTRPDVEVILLTGHPSVEAALEGMNQGAYAFVTKPANPEELLMRIRDAYEARMRNLDRSRRSTFDDILERYPE